MGGVRWLTLTRFSSVSLPHSVELSLGRLHYAPSLTIIYFIPGVVPGCVLWELWSASLKHWIGVWEDCGRGAVIGTSSSSKKPDVIHKSLVLGNGERSLTQDCVSALYNIF